LMPQGSPPKKPWGSTDGSCDLLLTNLAMTTHNNTMWK
jgi:hypothetical protein